MLRWKMSCSNEVYKFSLSHFSTGCIFYVLILKTLQNQEFYFLTKICEMRNKRQNAKLFTLGDIVLKTVKKIDFFSPHIYEINNIENVCASRSIFCIHFSITF